jgi:hypothetical protein
MSVIAPQDRNTYTIVNIKEEYLFGCHFGGWCLACNETPSIGDGMLISYSKQSHLRQSVLVGTLNCFGPLYYELIRTLKRF